MVTGNGSKLKSSVCLCIAVRRKATRLTRSRWWLPYCHDAMIWTLMNLRQDGVISICSTLFILCMVYIRDNNCRTNGPLSSQKRIRHLLFKMLNKQFITEITRERRRNKKERRIFMECADSHTLCKAYLL